MISRGGHGYKNAQVTMSHERTALTASPEELVSWSLTMAGPIPQEMLDAAAAKINSGQKDEFGGKGVNAFYTDDQAWCLTEADSPEAIGVTLGEGDITEAKSFVPV